MLQPTKVVNPDVFPDCCLTCKHFDIDVGNILGCSHPLVPRTSAFFSHWCEEHERNNQYVTEEEMSQQVEEVWYLQLCKNAGIVVASSLASEAALQVERLYPTRKWKEAVAAGYDKTYRAWVLDQVSA